MLEERSSNGATVMDLAQTEEMRVILSTTTQQANIPGTPSTTRRDSLGTSKLFPFCWYVTRSMVTCVAADIISKREILLKDLIDCCNKAIKAFNHRQTFASTILWPLHQVLERMLS